MSHAFTLLVVKTRPPVTAWVNVLAGMLLCCGSIHAEPLADPTRPFSAAEINVTAVPKLPATLRVEAIFHDAQAQRRRAIINGRLVHEGDDVDGAVIEHITLDAVRYSRAGRVQNALLHPDKLPVRKPLPTQLAAREEQP